MKKLPWEIDSKRSRQDGSQAAATEPANRGRWSRDHLIASLILAAITFAAYFPVLRATFIPEYDDKEYVIENAYLRLGLNTKGISWAFTTFREGNWHPLTWISHMADYHLYGLNPMGHHLTNLILHIASAILLFFLMTKMTNSTWKSAFVAALFALHPLHVESVAWVSERKDVLSGFFWFLTMFAYVRYAERPGILRYLPLLFAYALGLMAKPMMVTLPIALLLLDYWPLRRMSRRWGLVWEKLPLIALTAASCVLTFLAQRGSGAVVSLENYPLKFRLANVSISYVSYIWKTICPSKLATFYPIVGPSLMTWRYPTSALLLALVTAAAIASRKRYPYLLVGWLWFLITLVPMIGIVQVGMQSMANRYTYVPIVGLFLIVTWGITDLLTQRPKAKPRRERRGGSSELVASQGKTRALPIMGAAAIIVLSTFTWIEAGRWHDTITLFTHAIESTSGNFVAYTNVGEAYERQGNHAKAKEYLLESLRLSPEWPTTQVDLALALIGEGRFNEAITWAEEAKAQAPDYPDLQNNLATVYYKTGRLDEALDRSTSALKTDPSYALAHNTTGLVYLSQGKRENALSHLRLAAELYPESAVIHESLAKALVLEKSYSQAWREIGLCRKYGGIPDPALIRSLSAKMPEPGR